MGSLSPWHWAILAIVVVLLFGAKKLPDAARSLGKSMRIFRSEVRELQNEDKKSPVEGPTGSDVQSPPTTVQAERVDPPASGQSHTDARPA